MKLSINKTEAKQKIDEFFGQSSFTPEQLKKIRRIAMKFKIKLGAYRKQFCKKCLSQLKGKIRISKEKKGMYKTVECEKCGYKNKVRIAV